MYVCCILWAYHACSSLAMLASMTAWGRWKRLFSAWIIQNRLIFHLMIARSMATTNHHCKWWSYDPMMITNHIPIHAWIRSSLVKLIIHINDYQISMYIVRIIKIYWLRIRYKQMMSIIMRFIWWWPYGVFLCVRLLVRKYPSSIIGAIFLGYWSQLNR